MRIENHSELAKRNYTQERERAGSESKRLRVVQMSVGYC